MSQKKSPARVIVTPQRRERLEGPWHQLTLHFDAAGTRMPQKGENLPLLWPTKKVGYEVRGCVRVLSVRTIKFGGQKEWEVVVEKQQALDLVPRMT